MFFIMLFLCTNGTHAFPIGNRLRRWQQQVLYNTFFFLKERSFFPVQLPMFDGGSVDDEEGVLWREEKNKVGQGGERGGGEAFDAYILPGQRRTREGEEWDDKGGAGGDMEEMMWVAPLLYFDKEDKKGRAIEKRAWNSYFTGGFGKRSEDTTWRKGKARESVLMSKPLRS